MDVKIKCDKEYLLSAQSFGKRHYIIKLIASHGQASMNSSIFKQLAHVGIAT